MSTRPNDPAYKSHSDWFLEKRQGIAHFRAFLSFFARIFALFKKREALCGFLNRAKPRCLGYVCTLFTQRDLIKTMLNHYRSTLGLQNSIPLGLVLSLRDGRMRYYRIPKVKLRKIKQRNHAVS